MESSAAASFELQYISASCMETLQYERADLIACTLNLYSVDASVRVLYVLYESRPYCMYGQSGISGPYLRLLVHLREASTKLSFYCTV